LAFGAASFMRKLSYDFTPSRQEKRRAKRRTQTSRGSIRLEGGFASRVCTILNLSDHGARISVEGANKIPDVFTLIIAKNLQGRSARVKWRRGKEIGAEFV
jgi:hypothetical protein